MQKLPTVIDSNTPDLLPVGSQVVLKNDAVFVDEDGVTTIPAGSVGAITGNLPHPYNTFGGVAVLFPNGIEIATVRSELSSWRRQGARALEAAVGQTFTTTGIEEAGLLLFSVIVGSRAFGLHTIESDIDEKGVFQYPADVYHGLLEPERTAQRKDEVGETEYIELRHFLTLALKANPTILEVMWSPHFINDPSDLGEQLRANRHRFLSRTIFQTYNGYAMSQFHKLNHDLAATGKVKGKHAMHLMRMLVSGIHACRTGEILVDVGEYRDRLMSIRREEEPWERTNEWRMQLHHEFERAMETTKLPVEPDYAWANNFLVMARRELR